MPSLLAPGKLPALWENEEITVKKVADYFNGSTIVEIDRGGYKEPMQIPKAAQLVVDKSVSAAVESGILWLLSGPASILGEPIPAGVLNDNAKLAAPPEVIGAPEILPENLPGAWQDGATSALSIATALSIKAGKTLPWKTVRDVITAAINGRFVELTQDSQPWPNDFSAAQFIKLKAATGKQVDGRDGRDDRVPGVLQASAELSPSQIQDLGDIMPKLLEIKAKNNTPLKFHVRVEMGDGKTKPSAEAIKDANTLLKQVREDLELK